MSAMFHIMNDGCKISYSHHINEGKPTVLLSSSLGTTSAMWQPQLAALQEEFSVVTYDMRGHGKSDIFPGAYSIDRLGCDVIELLDFLQLEKVHYCGLSIGGMIGQWLAARCPQRINSLVLANTSAYIGPSSLWQDRINQVLSEGMESIWENVLLRWFTEPFIEANSSVIDKMKSIFVALHGSGYAACCAAIRDMDLRGIAIKNKLPTLIIAGTQDLATPVEQSLYLLSHYIDARLVKLDAGHLSNIERADEFTEHLTAFLK